MYNNFTENFKNMNYRIEEDLLGEKKFQKKHIMEFKL